MAETSNHVVQKQHGDVRRDALVNDILAKLPEHESEPLIAQSKIITVHLGEVVFEDAEPSDLAHFPLTSILSTMALMKDGRQVEYGSIGREGFVGLQAALHAQPLRGRAICQLEGEVLCVPGEHLRSLFINSETVLHKLLLRYAQSMINVLAQSAACNALHSVRERTARWLLMTRDRAGSDEFNLTQEFLSAMLGVRRAGVTDVASDLRRKDIIDYTNGHIRVLNGVALLEASCECYDVIRSEYARALDLDAESS